MGGLVARSSFVLASVWVGLACVGAPPPPPGADGSGSSTGAASETTASPPITTVSVEDTSATAGDTGTSTSSGNTSTSTGSGETTVGVGPTTSSSEGGESSSGASPPECQDSSDCPSNETCTAGACVDACAGVWGTGSYDYCLTPYGAFDTSTLCGPDHLCIYDAPPIDAVVCSRQGCVDACDCPAPPATGTATVTCDDITSNGSADCYLSCANGETCPDGMACLNALYCAEPVQPLPMYGNCGNVAALCIDGTCAIASDGMGNDWSVCVTVCNGVGDCDPAPPGANGGESCDTVISPPAGPECHLGCTASSDCPNGMACLDLGTDNLCMWPS